MLWIHLYHLIYTILIIHTAPQNASSALSQSVQAAVTKHHGLTDLYRNFSQFCRLEVWDHGASMARSGESSLLGLQMANLLALSSHGRECGAGRVSFLNSLLYKGTNVIMRAPPSWPNYPHGAGGVGKVRVSTQECGRDTNRKHAFHTTHPVLPFSSSTWLHNSNQELCCLLRPTTIFGFNICILTMTFPLQHTNNIQSLALPEETVLEKAQWEQEGKLEESGSLTLQ